MGGGEKGGGGERGVIVEEWQSQPCPERVLPACHPQAEQELGSSRKGTDEVEVGLRELEVCGKLESPLEIDTADVGRRNCGKRGWRVSNIAPIASRIWRKKYQHNQQRPDARWLLTTVESSTSLVL